MHSSPPATATSMSPTAMALAQMEMACRPEEQKRLMVWALTGSSPARRHTSRATFLAHLLTVRAQPITTSSISLGSSWGTLAMTLVSVSAAHSMGWIPVK